jgi:hypothetical protein
MDEQHHGRQKQETVLPVCFLNIDGMFKKARKEIPAGLEIEEARP